MAGRGRRYRGARGRFDISDEHEHEAMWELRRTRYSRIGHFLRSIVGWPIAPPSIGYEARRVNPSHEHPRSRDEADQ